MRATRLSFDVKFEMGPSSQVVVTHKFEIRAGAMRIVSGSFLASNVCLNEVQRGLSHIPSMAQPALGASVNPSDARPGVSIITAAKHNARDSDISWQSA